MLSFLFHKHKNNELIVALDKSKSSTYHLIDEKGFFQQAHQPNDIIGIKYNEKQLLKITSLLYGLPILLMVVFLIIGSMTFARFGMNSDLGGIIGFMLGLLATRHIIKNKKITPKVEFFK
jgi:positive regulator of sigma E activity